MDCSRGSIGDRGSVKGCSRGSSWDMGSIGDCSGGSAMGCSWESARGYSRGSIGCAGLLGIGVGLCLASDTVKGAEGSWL